MTSKRAQAYGRVVKSLDDLAATKLQPVEEQRIRDAADTLLFCESIDEPGVRDALEDVEALMRHLVEADRFTEERAQQVVADVSATGPLAAPVH